MPDLVLRFAIGALAAIVVTAAARRRRSLSRAGAVVAAAVGTIVVGGGGWWWGVLLVVFFAGSSALSLVRPERAGLAPHRGHERDAVQVLANGGVAAAIAAIGLITADGLAAVRVALFCGAIAAVNADTWATEIGRFNRTAPRLITSGRQVPPGTSGGVTPLGTGGAVLGAALIGALAAVGAAFGWLPAAPWPLLVGTTVAGLAGSLLDSLLGATIQARYRDRQSGQITERRVTNSDAPSELAHGYGWMSNDTVNLAASLTGAMAAGLIWRIAA